MIVFYFSVAGSPWGAQLGIVSCVNVADRAFCKLQNICICLFSGDFLLVTLVNHHEKPPFGEYF